MGTPAEFRKYAEECVELAQKAHSVSHRDLMLSMAETWLRLADQAQREAEWKAAAGPLKPGSGAAAPARRTAPASR
jgi:hypothetical protein